MSKIYKAPIVQAIQDYYGALLLPSKNQPNVFFHLEALASKLHQGLLQKHPPLFQQINNYHPDFLGQKKEKLALRTWTLEEARQCIASEYGFTSWDALNLQKDLLFNIDFELAVQAIIQGNEAGLRALLQQNHNIVNQTSCFGHQATLLHYTASNGVEMWRQQVPENLKRIVETLLEFGANKEAKMKVYGGAFSTHELFATSAHPKQAGVYNEVLPLLQADDLI